MVKPRYPGEEEEPIGFIEDRLSIHPIRVIARGGMGIVYEADLLGSEGFTKRVAVKTLRKKWCNNRRFVELLVAEAKLVSGLVHENIVQMHQLGQLPDGRHYVVMEYVNGLSLYELQLGLWRKGTFLPRSLAVHIASRVARGLGYAHSFRDLTGACLHIVHRDICPSNILVTTEGLTKLIDFGVAKARTMTIIGDDWRTGKISYMSPEQAMRQHVDYRSDIFALGGVLFEMLAGHPLRKVDQAIPAEDAAGLPIPWEKLRKGVDDELRAILARMLAPNPAERFDHADHAARALEEYIYRDGYGPTIQTIEAYLRQEFPDLYRYPERLCDPASTDFSTVTLPGRR